MTEPGNETPVDGHADRTGRTPPTAGPVTPPATEPGRPPVVTVAMVLWIVLGVAMVLIAALYGVALVVGAAESGIGVVLVMVVLVAAGVAVTIGGRQVGAGSRSARRALSIAGGVLAAIGLVQLTFLGVAGSWFVAFLVGAVLLHVPTARAWFAGYGP